MTDVLLGLSDGFSGNGHAPNSRHDDIATSAHDVTPIKSAVFVDNDIEVFTGKNHFFTYDFWTRTTGVALKFLDFFLHLRELCSAIPYPRLGVANLEN